MAKRKPKLESGTQTGLEAGGASSDVLLASMEAARREEIDREARRRELMSQIAKYRWQIAQHHHRLETGEKMDFEKYPFQKDIYLDDAIEQVIVGSVQWGKSELLVCTAASMAACGLRVFYVLSKYDKRNKFVAARITPAFREIPLYAAMLKAAKDRNAEADNASFKHFGPGSINFVGSNSEKDFTTYSCDAAIVDEHMECVLENISRIDSRMSGSPWRFKILVGNPRYVGTEENQNLDFEYQNTDRRQWNVPCPYCGMMQVLGWWSHFVVEEKNKHGAVLSIRPRDEEYVPGNILDMRPICTNCSRPMNRLSRDGQWIAQNPGHPRHGYQLSNLVNVNVRIDKLFDKYRLGLHDPSKMAEFINDHLGLPWTMEGSSISDRMLEQASRGDAAGIEPYRVLPALELAWEALS